MVDIILAKDLLLGSCVCREELKMKSAEFIEYRAA
jgi:hypothetical protein